MRKQYKFPLIWVLLCITVVGFGSVPNAYAGSVSMQLPPVNLDTCANNYAMGPLYPWDYTTKIVICIEGTIHDACLYMLQAISFYMVEITGAAFVLAMAIFGMRMLSGERELQSKAIGFAIRMGIVGMFAYNLGGYANAVFTIFHELIRIAASGWTPWGAIDYFLGNLLGFGPTVAGNPNSIQLTLLNGIIGLVGAAVFASTIGATLAMTGLMAIGNFLLFIIDVVYTYLSSVIVIAFLILISPFVIPLALFNYTERYVKKWIDILIAAILMPMLLFAFLSMSIGIFTFLIADVFQIIGAPCADPSDLSTCPVRNLSAFWRVDQPAYSWLVPNDPNLVNQLQTYAATTTGITPQNVQNIPAVQTTVNSMLHRSMNTNALNMPSIDFGRDNIFIMQQLILSFMTFWLFASMVKAMVHRIPGVATSIASVIKLNISMPKMSFKQRVREAGDNIKIGAGTMAGGVVGGQIGQAAARATGGGRTPIAQEIGGVLGGIGGALLGKRL